MMISFPLLKKAVLGSVLLCWVGFIYGETTTNNPVAAPKIDLIGQLPKGASVQASDIPTIIIPVDSLFKFPSSTQLLNDSRSDMLHQIAQILRRYSNRLITVSGHTDNVGSDAAKLKRSHDQADTVAAYLWSEGIPLKNLLVVGRGDTEPVASNKTPAGSAANRRIEIKIQ